jgi:hypothetical protein
MRAWTDAERRGETADWPGKPPASTSGKSRICPATGPKLRSKTPGGKASPIASTSGPTLEHTTKKFLGDHDRQSGSFAATDKR